MTSVPDYVPMLTKGATDDPREGGCLVQIANWLVNPSSWTDDPECVSDFLADYAMLINDGVGDDMRHRLALQAPRLGNTRVNSSAAVTNGLYRWLETHEPPFRFVPSQDVVGDKRLVKLIKLPVFRLVGTELEAVQWLEALIDEHHRLAGTEPVQLTAERWLEVKEHVSQ